MAPQIFARGQAGVDIANAFMVGDKIDAVANPAGRGDVAIEIEQPAKCAFACRVHIEIASGAATIALPERWLTRISAKHDCAMRPKGDGSRGSVWQRSRWPAGWSDLVKGDHSSRWLSSGAGVNDR